MRSLAIGSFVLAAAAAPCLAQSLEVKAGSPVSIEKLAIDAKVEEGFALVAFDETFRNATGAQQEGVWKFRLPADAVVASFSMWMNGQEKTGRVLEARQARAVYDSIVRKRKDPGLLEQTGWRDFQVSVFPIPARDTVRVRIRYAYALPDDLGLETLEVPLPVGCGAVGDLRVQATFSAARGLATLDCPSHKDAKLFCAEGRGAATWSADGVAPTGPMILRAVPKRDGFDVAVLVHRPAGSDEGFFVARIVPRLAAPPSIGRDVAFVFDRSGSMEGTKIAQARLALLRGIDSLRPGDRFNVVSFSTDVASLAGGPLLPADAASLDRARAAARELSASGGTNIAGALDAALALRSADASRLFAVVFLTDGDPTVGETDPGRILAAWRAKSAGAARLFAFGVGGDVKDFLLTKLAAEGRGAATYVRSDDDLEVKLSALVDAVKTPLLLDPEVTVEGAGVEVLDREPRRVPDVFQGRALVVAGRFRGAGKATLHLSGRSGGDVVDVAVPVDLAATAERPHVAQIWAKTRIERLLDDLRASGGNREIRDEIVRLGVRHQVVTPYTSFLVVEDGVHVPDPSETARVPDAPANPEGPTTADPDTRGPTTGGGGGRTAGRGPAGEVPPDSREPSDPPPPPEAGGPQTPGAESSGGPTTGGGGGPATGGGGKRSIGGRGYEDWTWWWTYAWRDVVAPVDPARRVAATPETLGLLRARARDENESFHVRSKALLALAAMGDAEIVPDLLRIAAITGRDHRRVIEAATLALGLLPRKSVEVRAFLLDAVRRDGAGSFSPAFAAAALGLRREGVDADAAATLALFEVLDDPRELDPNVRAACLLSIGRLGDVGAAKRLLPLLAGPEPDRPYVVEALGRLGGDDVADALTALLAKSRSGDNAARSATTALARVASRASPAVRRRIVEALAAELRAWSEATSRGWSALALGRIAGDPATDAAARDRALVVLRGFLEKGNDSLARSYAALGLAFAVRGGGLSPADAKDVRHDLREGFADPRRCERPAVILALGLAGDDLALKSLRAQAVDPGAERAVHEFAALAASMIDWTAAGEALARVGGGDDERGFVAQAAAAAGDPSLAPMLVVRLRNPDASSIELRTLARALGRCGDAASVEALRVVAADEAHTHPDLTRAYAVASIGRLCADLSPLDAYVEGLNFRAWVPAVAEVTDLR